MGIGHVDEKRARALLLGLKLAAENKYNALPPSSKPPCDLRPDSYTPTLDGLELAPPAMNDGSAPPPFTRHHDPEVELEPNEKGPPILD